MRLEVRAKKSPMKGKSSAFFVWWIWCITGINEVNPTTVAIIPNTSISILYSL